MLSRSDDCPVAERSARDLAVRSLTPTPAGLGVLAACLGIEREKCPVSLEADGWLSDDD